MGAYLCSPITEKESEEGESDQYKWGASAMQGWRPEMEDAHTIALNVGGVPSSGFFGVFDGHGGREVAKFCSLYMANELVKMEAYRQGNIGTALSQVFLKMDELMVREDQQAELRQLAARTPQDTPDRAWSEENLPEAVKQALLQARLRTEARTRHQANGGRGIEDEEEEDSDSEFESELVAALEAEAPQGLPHEGGEGDEDSEPGEDAGPGSDKDADTAGSSEQGPGGAEEGKIGYERLEPVPSADSTDLEDMDHLVANIVYPNGKRQRTVFQGALPVSGAQPACGSPHPEDGLDGGFGAGARERHQQRRGKPEPGLEGAAENASGGAGGAETSGSPRSGSGSLEVTVRGAAGAGQSSRGGGSGAQLAFEATPDGPSNLSTAPVIAASPWQRGIDRFVGPSAGCTAVVALVHEKRLFVANAGDSRCVLSRGGQAVAMTHDHKPDDDEEHDRIIKAGGFITDGRVNGSLNLSRALGDMEYKQGAGLTPAEQMVTAVPEVRALELGPGDEFLVLGCDGIWDVLSNQEAVDFVRERLLRGMAPKAICEAVCDRCLAPDTNGQGQGCDNMSVIVVVLKEYAALKAEGPAPGPINIAATPRPEEGMKP